MTDYLKIILLLLLALPVVSSAGDDTEQCRTVRLADTGWSNLEASNALAIYVLRRLGYQPKLRMMSVPVTYTTLNSGKTDVFLGDWQPISTQSFSPPHLSSSVQRVRVNLEGARHTLAVPSYVADAGIRDIADLAAHSAKFRGKIYGLEPGNLGNQIISDLISLNRYNLHSFKLVISSEVAMLSSVKRAIRAREWVVFLSWQPHPLNISNSIVYLKGEPNHFGPDRGSASVHTLARQSYLQQCPNVSHFLKNLYFTIPLLNHVMLRMLEEGAETSDAVISGLRQHPELLNDWLAGVTIFGSADKTKKAIPWLRQGLGLPLDE